MELVRQCHINIWNFSQPIAGESSEAAPTDAEKHQGYNFYACFMLVEQQSQWQINLYFQGALGI